MKECRTCHAVLPLGEFFRNRGTSDGRLNHCKRCFMDKHRKAIAERARIGRARIQQIKLERGCADCGYRSHPAALDFDHLPGTKKLHRIACLAEARLEVIEAEIAKCEVVCANCHRIRTAERLRSTDG